LFTGDHGEYPHDNPTHIPISTIPTSSFAHKHLLPYGVGPKLIPGSNGAKSWKFINFSAYQHLSTHISGNNKHWAFVSDQLLPLID
jgi:hypothetical protein